jgi:hypothetical protein
MRFVLTNAFSPNMLDWDSAEKHVVRMEKASVDEARFLLAPEGHLSDVVLAIGHADTARLVGGLLGLPEEDIARMVEAAKTRPTIKVGQDDILVVAQYIGPRLPEGATSLPEGARVEFFIVVVD